MPMTLMTQAMPLRKFRSVNCTSTSFVQRLPQAIEPVDDSADATGQCSINMSNGSGVTQNGLMIVPYGLHASITDNLTFSIRVVGYRRLGSDPATLIWVGPITFVEALCTVDNTLIGLAGRLIVATEMFCDTITLVGTSGNANVSHELLSPADGVTIAHLMVDTKGCERVSVEMSTGSSVTSCNCLVAAL